MGQDPGGRLQREVAPPFLALVGLVLALAAASTLTGCGDSETTPAAGGDRPTTSTRAAADPPTTGTRAAGACPLDLARASASVQTPLTPLPGEPCTFLSADRETAVATITSTTISLATVREQADRNGSEVIDAPEYGDGAFVQLHPDPRPRTFHVTATYLDDGVTTTVMYGAPKTTTDASDPRAAIARIIQDSRR